MQNLFDIHEWKVVQTKFDPHRQEEAESIFSIGNGSFGQRANFEEKYSGESLQGSYVGGVYYPDNTRVGWWKNGYPEYFAKVLNSCNWIGIHLEYQGTEIDLAQLKVKSFYRELDMEKGLLTRRARVLVDKDKELEIVSTRFCSMANEEVAAIQYTVTAGACVQSATFNLTILPPISAAFTYTDNHLCVNEPNVIHHFHQSCQSP